MTTPSAASTPITSGAAANGASANAGNGRPTARWILPSHGEGVAELAAALGIGLPAARVLWSRGYRDTAIAQAFLRPGIEGLHDPFLLHGMTSAVDRLLKAIGVDASSAEGLVK